MSGAIGGTTLSITLSAAVFSVPMLTNGSGILSNDKLQPCSCRTPPVPTSSYSFDQWLQLSFSHACLVVPNSPCVCLLKVLFNSPFCMALKKSKENTKSLDFDYTHEEEERNS